MVLKYKDLSLEGYFTLGDAVLFGKITEKDALELAGKDTLNELPFGRLIHEGLRKKKFLERVVGEESKKWFRDYLQELFHDNLMDSLYGFPLREEHLDKIREKWGRRFTHYSEWNDFLLYNGMLDLKIPEYPGQLPLNFSNAVKACNFFLNPYSEHNFKIWDSYVDTLLTLFDCDNDWLLRQLKEDLMWLGRAYPDNTEAIATVLKNPRALVHYYREFSDFHDWNEFTIAFIDEIRRGLYKR